MKEYSRSEGKLTRGQQERAVRARRIAGGNPAPPPCPSPAPAGTPECRRRSWCRCRCHWIKNSIFPPPALPRARLPPPPCPGPGCPPPPSPAQSGSAGRAGGRERGREGGKGGKEDAAGRALPRRRCADGRRGPGRAARPLHAHDPGAQVRGPGLQDGVCLLLRLARECSEPTPGCLRAPRPPRPLPLPAAAPRSLPGPPPPLRLQSRRAPLHLPRPRPCRPPRAPHSAARSFLRSLVYFPPSGRSGVVAWTRGFCGFGETPRLALVVGVCLRHPEPCFCFRTEVVKRGE